MSTIFQRVNYTCDFLSCSVRWYRAISLLTTTCADGKSFDDYILIMSPSLYSHSLGVIGV